MSPRDPVSGETDFADRGLHSNCEPEERVCVIDSVYIVCDF